MGGGTKPGARNYDERPSDSTEVRPSRDEEGEEIVDDDELFE
jgi:hypothetical protein